MKMGTKVVLKETVPEPIWDAVASLESRGVRIIGTVQARTGEEDVFTVVLPEGVVFPGHSRPFGADQHYVDLHVMHLQPSEEG